MLLLLLTAGSGFAQFTSDSARLSKRRLIAGLPVVFYTPETRFGFGLSGICIFNFKSDTLLARRSSVGLGAIYTQNRQVLFNLPYNLFLKNRSYHLYGEIAYNRYLFNFYGTGNNMPEDYVERYGIEFPRLRITALKKIVNGFFAGVRYARDQFRLYDLEPAGLLANNLVKGSEGGTISGVGAVLMYDTRDMIYYPKKGMWTELVLYHDDPRTGSSFNYSRIAFDLSRYFSFLEKNTVAVNLYSILTNSELPFFQMATLGGLKKMRGFYEGRYRDNNAILFQAEYRRELPANFGFTVFGSAGQVAPEYVKFNHKYWRYTYGLGLRYMIDKLQKLNLRIDLAVGNKKLLPYFTIGEAF